MLWIGAAMTSDFEMPARILVVEDDRTIRLMLVKTFEATSEVLAAEDGATALRLMRTERPDFVVTDLMLPELSGLDLITRARRTYWGALVPILVLTANTRAGTLMESFRCGADDFMVKPFSLQELRIRVASIYVRHQVARDRNPLTGIPGNTAIKREVEARLQEGRRFSLATFDLDHFKAFNDSRGFDSGDEAIRMLAEILEAFAIDEAGDDAFVGHIGGDDFVVLCLAEQVPRLANFVHTRFAQAIRRFYESEELETGTVDIVNRHGETERVPLLSVSIGVVDSGRPGLDDYRGLVQVSAEVKKVAKAIPGNSIFVDRRRA